MLIKFQTLIILMLTAGSVRSQSLGPAILNSTGGQASIGANTYEYSIGEMSLVNTASAPGIIVTQGTLQPSLNSSSIHLAEIAENELSVYPVPTSSVLTIQPKFNTGGKLHFTLLDAAGKQVMDNTIFLSSGIEIQQLNIEAYASGNYLLNISYDTKSGTVQKVFKIQKTQ